MDQTNETQLVLQKVTPKFSGKYSCEVSADAPSFATSIVSGEMEVVGMNICNLSLFDFPTYESKNSSIIALSEFNILRTINLLS